MKKTKILKEKANSFSRNVKTFEKEKNGITLIALVITIVLNCCEAAMERKLIKSNIILKI